MCPEFCCYVTVTSGQKPDRKKREARERERTEKLSPEAKESLFLHLLVSLHISQIIMTFPRPLRFEVETNAIGSIIFFY